MFREENCFGGAKEKLCITVMMNDDFSWEVSSRLMDMILKRKDNQWEGQCDDQFVDAQPSVISESLGDQVLFNRFKSWILFGLLLLLLATCFKCLKHYIKFVTRVFLQITEGLFFLLKCRFLNISSLWVLRRYILHLPFTIHLILSEKCSKV